MGSVMIPEALKIKLKKLPACPGCQRKLPVNVKFCPSCGKEIPHSTWRHNVNYQTTYKNSPFYHFIMSVLPKKRITEYEKMEGWLGLMKFNRVQYCDDDVKELIEQLKQGKGALLINSHIGNMELLRSLSEHNKELVGRDVPVLVIMEVNPNEQFTNTLKEVNPKFALNVVDSSNIGPDTICYLMEEIDKGALVIIAGDRTSAHARDKFIVHNFLGKPAPFPYGTFLIPFLMKCPVYYMFGLRKKLSLVNPVYKVYIEKSKIDFDCPRNKREEGINNLCLEFIEKLEKFCRMYPYQWYNFFNFWNMEPEKK